MDQIELKIILFGTKNTFFVEMLFAEKTLSEDIILDEVSLGRSPTIKITLIIGFHIPALSWEWSGEAG